MCTIKPPNFAMFGRDGDADVIETFLRNEALVIRNRRQTVTGPATASMIPALGIPRRARASLPQKVIRQPPNPIGRVKAATIVPIAPAKAGLNPVKDLNGRATVPANRRPRTAADRVNLAIAPGSGRAVGSWSIATAKIPASRLAAPEPTTVKLRG